MWWNEEEPLPPGYDWLPIPMGVGPYRVQWERMVGGHPVYRPARKL